MIIPKVLESRTEYAGKIVSIRRDKLTRGDGNTFIRETAVASDAVGIVAMDDRGRILLIRQYRHPMGRPVWEIPAGRMDVEGEKPEETALRELREETDTEASSIQLLTLFLRRSILLQTAFHMSWFDISMRTGFALPLVLANVWELSLQVMPISIWPNVISPTRLDICPCVHSHSIWL